MSACKTTTALGRPSRKTLMRVMVKLCAANCRLCHGQHTFTEPMDATRLADGRVRITQPHGLWYGAVLRHNDFKFCEDDA